tara:strand:- start:2524 stop:3498 length:975 start_codon:yes stop_codon:yes gene_type:complete
MCIIKISIIIPNYNSALLIERCLNSVFNQTGDYNLEVIVVDDESTDNSLEVLGDYTQSLIVLRQASQGPAAARNKGIAAATGKYLAFLDADDYWEPYFLKETVSFLENQDAIAVSVGQVHKIIGKEDKVMPQLIEAKHKLPTKGILLDNFYKFWAIHNHVCTGSVLMKTDIVKQTGGQRPELRITEDLEFWAYLATFGKFGFIPKVLFVSDGGLVTKEQGWLEKNKKRWASAPSLYTWDSRILKRVHKNQLTSFKLAKAPIVRNLSYAMMLSNRAEEARKNIIEHKNTLGNDKLSMIMKFSSYTKLSWFFLCELIKKKEYSRKF